MGCQAGHIFQETHGDFGGGLSATTVTLSCSQNAGTEERNKEAEFELILDKKNQLYWFDIRRSQ